MVLTSIPKPKILFAGSFLEHSALILEKLMRAPEIEIIGVLTTPPQPGGRSKILIPTPVHQLAISHNLPVFTPTNLNEKSLAEIEKNIGRPTLLLTAGYGKLVPSEWLTFPQLAALNLHFSLLPAYRGANPAEWALIRGETITGVTLIEMSPSFDTGKMVAQSALPIAPTETRETLYQKLYQLGGDVLPAMLSAYVAFRSPTDLKNDTGYTSIASEKGITYFLPPLEQTSSPTPYATRLTREAGFIGWTALKDAVAGKDSAIKDLSPQLAEIIKTTSLELNARFLERTIRALVGFPGVWTLVTTAKGEQRLKILQAHLGEGRPATTKVHLILDTVQLEGQTITSWENVKNLIL